MKKGVAFCVSAALVLASCFSPGRRQQQESFRMIDLRADSTLYATCLEVLDGGDSLVVFSDEGDTISLTLEGATVCGQPQVGCPLAIMRYSDGRVRKLVDVALLMGSWVEPDPIDEGADMGISLLEGGDASSINSRVHNYTRWAFYNGSLILTSQTDIGGITGADVVDTFDIVTLSTDSLVLESGGYTFHYAHPNDSARRFDAGLLPADTATDYIDFLY